MASNTPPYLTSQNKRVYCEDDTEPATKPSLKVQKLSSQHGIGISVKCSDGVVPCDVQDDGQGDETPPCSTAKLDEAYDTLQEAIKSMLYTYTHDLRNSTVTEDTFDMATSDLNEVKQQLFNIRLLCAELSCSVDDIYVNYVEKLDFIVNSSAHEDDDNDDNDVDDDDDDDNDDNDVDDDDDVDMCQ